jgi:hypothetical protein
VTHLTVKIQWVKPSTHQRFEFRVGGGELEGMSLSKPQEASLVLKMAEDKVTMNKVKTAVMASVAEHFQDEDEVVEPPFKTRRVFTRYNNCTHNAGPGWVPLPSEEQASWPIVLVSCDQREDPLSF